MFQNRFATKSGLAIAVAVLVAACSSAGNSTAPQIPPIPATGSQTLGSSKTTVRYELFDLGTLGGPNSGVPEAFLQINGSTSVPTISAQGEVIATADTANADPFCFFDDCFYPGALAFRDGNVTTLPALPNSPWSTANAISRNAIIAGTSENGQLDPLTSLPELRGVIWRAGSVTDLGIKDGNNSAAFAVNNMGEAAGYTTNTTPDPFLGFQQKAARFDRGIVQNLPTLGGPDAIALLINDRGQIAGVSLTSTTPAPHNPCVGDGDPPLDPFLWDHGSIIDIGGFGGSCGMVNAMNDRGQVVGQSYRIGDTVARAFLWQSGRLRDLGTLGGSNASAESINDAGVIVGYADLSGGGCSGLSCIHHGFVLKNGTMTDLGTLEGHPCSRALSVNSRGQVVGGAANVCGGSFRAAILWENASAPIDLNTLVPPGATLHLDIAMAISDNGVIAGNGTLPNGDTHAFVLVPCVANCKEVKLGNVSTFSSHGQLTERRLQVQRTRVLTWHRNRLGSAASL